MTSAELFGLTYFSLLAFGAALGLIAVQGAFLSIESRFARWTLPWVPVMLCLGIGMSTLLSGRNLKFAAVDIQSVNSVGEGGSQVARALTALILAVCFAKIVSRLMRSRLHRSNEILGGQALFVAFLLYFFATHVLSAAFGGHPVFVHNSYYPIAVFVAFFMARDEGMERSLDSLKLALLLLMLGSLAAAALLPSLAVQTDYPGWIPGFKIRLWGLGSNANSIGPLALLMGLMLYHRPFGRIWLDVPAWIALLAVFGLAQSKTVWVAGIVCALILSVYGRGRDETGRIKPAFLLGVVTLVLVMFTLIVAVDFERFAGKFAATKMGGELSTLTGRTSIWAEALRAWMDDFWFGYGPDAWGPLHRFRIGMPFAFHAHNQLMQSLSSAGLFGGVSMLAYLYCMLAASWRAARYTKGVSLALALVVLARVMSEAPLQLDGLFIGETVIHLAWFLIVLSPFGQKVVDARVHARPYGQPRFA